MTQLMMTGNDWTSDQDKKSQARAEAARKKAGLACAKKLEAAADALSEFISACNECRDASSEIGGGVVDGRTRLIRDNMEYSCWLASKYSTKETA